MNPVAKCESEKLCSSMQSSMSVIRNGVFYLTNRFHVAVCNFSARSQITLKCNKNKNVVHKVQLSLSLTFIPHFQ